MVQLSDHSPITRENVPACSGSVKERVSIFGGARPRELVLKEHGVDESVIVGIDLAPSSAPSPISSVRTPIEGNHTSIGILGYGTEKQEKLDERSRREDQHETRMGRQASGRLERMSVFGGARQRELVLKECGVDGSVIVGTYLAPSCAPSPISNIHTPIEGNRTSSGSLGYGTKKQEKLDERSRRADQHETRMGRQASGRLEWMSVFGGARSRELVLKERGVDESVIVGTDLAPRCAPSPISVRTPIEGNHTSSGSLGYGTKKQEKLDERSRRADQHETKMGRQDSGRLEWMSAFGGARPRELVSKEHRVDESVIVGTDLAHSSAPWAYKQYTHTY
ncbi:hypothetical protein GOP47_0003062 [Adiantum capillus-veneris]|uniref:Uncharacterized protein n=1 Tax=Adiantum capillus-veneris TaxID=13818 RepID=A0A9D4ZPR2_ADICA|nr:hypothetical protein GOP47_0003062 [Adiantum capillus-veneris]